MLILYAHNDEGVECTKAFGSWVLEFDPMDLTFMVRLKPSTHMAGLLSPAQNISFLSFAHIFPPQSLQNFSFSFITQSTVNPFSLLKKNPSFFQICLHRH